MTIFHESFQSGNRERVQWAVELEGSRCPHCATCNSERRDSIFVCWTCGTVWEMNGTILWAPMKGEADDGRQSPEA